LVAGTPVQWIDTAARQYGMPFGPLELLDDLGWGLSQAVSESVSDEFGERIKLPKEIYFPIDAGFDGKSNNKGIYVWESNGKKAGVNAYVQESMGAVSSDEEPTPEEITKIQAALFLPMIDEASRILEDKVVKKPRDIDLALIIGAGYPPFRGGLLRSADKMGIDHVIEGLERIYSDKNQRREISNLLREMHNIGRKFYSLS
ncbi:MAG TPA: 3-hydroxyacyl-CoA dehydrogenase family protein, partial [Candidatus Melainabacteria bacterium]|nr:3-hydroxyacyl-CoA dehydrogenase family protein [Candidatus Melainabacteria bacterium]